VEREYRKIALNDHSRRSDDIDLLSALGEEGWELVTITSNSIAYLKREIEGGEPTQSQTDKPGEVVSGVRPKYRDPVTGDTWSGRGRMASWLKAKQDAGEDIEKYRV
jgi:DNA-binding protein H-NS